MQACELAEKTFSEMPVLTAKENCLLVMGVDPER